MIKISDIIRVMEEWAPPGIAWERDNVGLQIGDPEAEVKGVIVALEITQDVIRETLRKNCNLIITHHPLIFKPLNNLTPRTFAGGLALEIARNGLHLFSAHTNLDFSANGVNFAFGELLGLQNMRFLYQEGGSTQKIVVFVPQAHVDAVVGAMTRAGAGIIGNYESCSFQSAGTGTFQPLEGAQPFSGDAGALQREDEMRVEMVVPRWKTGAVVASMVDAHPYEEVAYDLYPIESINPNYGAGVIGSLTEPMPVEEFIAFVKQSLNSRTVRWTYGAASMVSRVAICGGSGSDLLPAATRQNADAFVTADIKYHTFHEARGSIHLIDAGHYETESPVLRPVADRLLREFSGAQVPFLVTDVNTNPITYS
jgi:dinuclear metal center YbgI/SA1388 family protein